MAASGWFRSRWKSAPRASRARCRTSPPKSRQRIALRESEAQFRVVAETAACAFLVYQGSRLLLRANPAAERITGYSQAELLDDRLSGIWPIQTFGRSCSSADWGDSGAKLCLRATRLKLLTKSGQERWIDFTAGVVELKGTADRDWPPPTTSPIAKRLKPNCNRPPNRESDLLAEIALRIRRSLNLEEILNTTVAEVRQFLHADRVVHFQL